MDFDPATIGAPAHLNALEPKADAEFYFSKAMTTARAQGHDSATHAVTEVFSERQAPKAGAMDLRVAAQAFLEAEKKHKEFRVEIGQRFTGASGGPPAAQAPVLLDSVRETPSAQGSGAPFAGAVQGSGLGSQASRPSVADRVQEIQDRYEKARTRNPKDALLLGQKQSQEIMLAVLDETARRTADQNKLMFTIDQYISAAKWTSQITTALNDIKGRVGDALKSLTQGS